MTTKELLEKELATLDEKDLSEIYGIVKGFIDSKRSACSGGLMSKLKRIKINAPPDFATNLDLYMSGNKRVE